MYISEQLLNSIDACDPQVERFKVLFPDGQFLLTSDNLLRCEEGGLNVMWVVQQLIPVEKQIELGLWLVENVMDLNSENKTAGAFLVAKKKLTDGAEAKEYKDAAESIRMDRDDKGNISKAKRKQKNIDLAVFRLNRALYKFEESEFMKVVETIMKHTRRARVIIESANVERKREIRKEQYEKVVELVEAAQP